MNDKKRCKTCLLWLLLGLVVAGVAAGWPGETLATANEDSRIALVIGNSNYAMSPLTNPVNDARAMSEVLRKLGFDVVTLLDASYPDMLNEVRRFGDRSRGGGGIGLFYFAGHGIQMSGTNYLIPVDADIRKEHEVKYNTLNMNQVLDEMELSRNRVNIIILDACRNNPFARSFRSISKGLAHIDAPSGTLIAFATAPGSVASDGVGANGLYTEEILKYIQEPGVPIEQVFKWVRGGVLKQTSGEQVPWESSSLVGDFYFNPAPQLAMPIQPAVVAQASAPSATAVDPKKVELTYWESIKNSQSAGDYKAYLDAYPEGVFAALAKVRARRYETAAVSRVGAVAPAVTFMPVVQQPIAAPAATDAPPVTTASVEAAPVASASLRWLVQKAQLALRNNQLLAPATDNAVKWGRQALALDPHNLQASQVLQQVIEHFLHITERDLDHGEVAKAQGNIAQAWELRAFASDEQKARMVDLKLRAEQEQNMASRIATASAFISQRVDVDQDSADGAQSSFGATETPRDESQSVRANPAQDLLRLLAP